MRNHEVSWGVSLFCHSVLVPACEDVCGTSVAEKFRDEAIIFGFLAFCACLSPLKKGILGNAQIEEAGGVSCAPLHPECQSFLPL